MLPLDDPRWQTYLGGYRVLYDASGNLRRLLLGIPTDSIWDELWEELHHQGDVDQASYATVPWLLESIRRSPRLDGNALRLIATIELERGRRRNPEVACELAVDYFAAMRSLPEVLGTHPDGRWGGDVIGPAFACIALARGHRWYAGACIELDRDAADRWFREEFGWVLEDD